MQLNDAKLAGKNAFESGRSSAPALNQKFIVEACAQKETPLIDLLAAYICGWTIANLAENALDGAPSLAAYEKIKKAN